MRNEERRDNDGWDEERRPQRLGTDADADLGLVDCVQEISRTPDVEQPHNAMAQTAWAESAPIAMIARMAATRSP